jgi:hypothetical protein
MSDDLIHIGPFRIGLDGLTAWIPAAGEIYSALAASFLLVQGYRARVPAGTLLIAAALMGGRTLIEAFPLLGPLAADLLTLHRMSARLIIAAIDRRLAAEGAEAAAWVRPAPRLPLSRGRENAPA